MIRAAAWAQRRGASRHKSHCYADVDVRLVGGACHTKIVATVGPACETADTLEGMMQRGMSVARLNFSHGSQDEHRRRVTAVREAARRLGREEAFAVALDTRGPEIRTSGNAGRASIDYPTGGRVQLRLAGTDFAGALNDARTLHVAYPQGEVPVGTSVLVADGQVALRVLADQGGGVLACEVTCGGTLSGRNNVHLQGTSVALPALSDADVADIDFAVRELGVDIVFASFARSAVHVREVKAVVDAAAQRREGEAARVPVVAKVESAEGMANLDGIIETSDGVMVARGDLGMDLPLTQLWAAQKRMIARANVYGSGRPVICATQMLESMVHNSRPTRAEATDVANAVLDGADAVMLSGETAKGAHPLTAVEAMRDLAAAADHVARTKERFLDLQGHIQYDNTVPRNVRALAASAVHAAFDAPVRCIVAFTPDGAAARLLAQLRPPCPIVAVSPSLTTCRTLALCSGVRPVRAAAPVAGALPPPVLAALLAVCGTGDATVLLVDAREPRLSLAFECVHL